MAYPIIVLTDTKTDWAKVMRSTIHGHAPFTMTASLSRLKKIIRSEASKRIVIIDTKQVQDPVLVIKEIIHSDSNVVVLAATSSLDWADTVAFVKAGAAEVLYKTIDPKQIIDSLRPFSTKSFE